MTEDTTRIREASGNVQSNDPLVAFLYLLMRSHLPAGVVADIILDVKSIRADNAGLFSNGWLARYAEDCAARLRPEPPSVGASVSSPASGSVTFLSDVLRARTTTEAVEPLTGKDA